MRYGSNGEEVKFRSAELRRVEEVLREILDRLPEPDQASGCADCLMDLDRVAEKLGVARRTVEEFVGTGELRSVSIARRRLIDPHDLRKFIEARKSWRLKGGSNGAA